VSGRCNAAPVRAAAAGRPTQVGGAALHPRPCTHAPARAARLLPASSADGASAAAAAAAMAATGIGSPATCAPCRPATGCFGPAAALPPATVAACSQGPPPGSTPASTSASAPSRSGSACAAALAPARAPPRGQPRPSLPCAAAAAAVRARKPACRPGMRCAGRPQVLCAAGALLNVTRSAAPRRRNHHRKHKQLQATAPRSTQARAHAAQRQCRGRRRRGPKTRRPSAARLPAHARPGAPAREPAPPWRGRAARRGRRTRGQVRVAHAAAGQRQHGHAGGAAHHRRAGRLHRQQLQARADARPGRLPGQRLAGQLPAACAAAARALSSLNPDPPRAAPGRPAARSLRGSRPRAEQPVRRAAWFTLARAAPLVPSPG